MEEDEKGRIEVLDYLSTAEVRREGRRTCQPLTNLFDSALFSKRIAQFHKRCRHYSDSNARYVIKCSYLKALDAMFNGNAPADIMAKVWENKHLCLQHRV